MGIAQSVSNLFSLIELLLFIYIILTWIPSINWFNQPFAFLRKFADIFFGPFRKLIPPIGMLDISPIVAFLVLGFIGNLIVNFLVKIGL